MTSTSSTFCQSAAIGHPYNSSFALNIKLKIPQLIVEPNERRLKSVAHLIKTKYLTWFYRVATYLKFSRRAFRHSTSTASCCCKILDRIKRDSPSYSAQHVYFQTGLSIRSAVKVNDMDFKFPVILGKGRVTSHVDQLRERESIQLLQYRHTPPEPESACRWHPNWRWETRNGVSSCSYHESPFLVGDRGRVN